MARAIFRFSLAKLLKFRILREKLERSKLEGLKADLAREQGTLADLRAREARIIEKLTPQKGATIDPDEFLRLERWLETVGQQIRRQEGKVEQARQNVATQQQVVNEALKDVKVLEKLEEQQREEHRLEQLRLEQVLLDDLAAQQFIRRGAEGRRIRQEHVATLDEAAFAQEARS